MMENEASVDRQIWTDAVKGLSKPQKELPSKLFYDERGSKLFEQITYLDEYYLTRTERSILQTNISQITSGIGRRAMLVELGSGSSSKTRFLLEELPELAAYIPIDISKEYLLKVVNQLRMEYPRISIIPVFADYTTPFNLPPINSYDTQVIFFPGSTIGNFHPDSARIFFENLASSTDTDSAMLIGVDLKKDKEILEAAYNDKEGVTAKFNKNILRRLNRELNANFEISCFSHCAFYNEAEGRIEMHLVADKPQQVEIAGEYFSFEQGESIHTENSYKYSLQEFRQLISDWYTVKQVWTDEKEYFSLQFLTKK